jgi:hypothetical protein
MSRTKQRTLQFDCMDEKVMLSVGVVDPASSVARAVVNDFHLNGALVGIPLGSSVQTGFKVSIFLVQGRMSSMGRVTGFVNLVDNLIPAGKKPNLNGASIVLVNKEGTVTLSIKQNMSRYYSFAVDSGTGNYVGAAGSGLGVLLRNGQSKALSFVIRLHTTSATNS